MLLILMKLMKRAVGEEKIPMVREIYYTTLHGLRNKGYLLEEKR